MLSKKITRGLWVVFVVVTTILALYNPVTAATTVTVHNQTELVDKVDNATSDIVVEFAIDFNETLTEPIDFNPQHSYAITIDGKNKKLLGPDLQRAIHMSIYLEKNNSLILKNLNFVGNATLDSNGYPDLTDDIFGGLKINGVDDQGSEVLLDNLSFAKIVAFDASLFLAGLKTVEINDTSFSANQSNNVSSIYANQLSNINIKNSEFSHNLNDNPIHSAYFQGNVRLLEISKQISISDSLFEYNNCANLYGAGMNGGGALGINLNNTKTTQVGISNNIFTENDANYLDNEYNARGGAIGISNIQNNEVIIEKSLFKQNKAGSNGSAIVLSLETNSPTSIGEETTIRNSTFTKNVVTAYDYEIDQISQGGAIHLESSYGIFKPKIYENTIVSNKLEVVEPLKSVNFNVFGAGITAQPQGVENQIIPNIRGNIILNNQLTNKGNTISSDYLNVNVQTPVLSNNLGVDNGSPINSKDTFKNIFGNDIISLADNNGKLAGLLKSKKIIQSYMIIPKTADMGLADNSSVYLVDTDQREKNRSKTTPDIGAVEIGSIKYDGNGGKWSLPTLPNYFGDIFYETNNPKQIYYTKNLFSKANVINNKDLSNGTKEFLGWSTNKKATKANIMPGSLISVTEQTFLYAIWKTKVPVSKAVVLTFDKNAKDAKKNGKITSAKLTRGKSLNQMKLSFPTPTRKGYRLLGWSTATNGQVNFTLNTKVSKDLKIYAVWQKSPERFPDTGQNINVLWTCLLTSFALIYLKKKTI